MDFEKEINAIKERNRRVEADKAWETSLTRMVLVAVLTYATILIFLLVIGAPAPWLTALVPMIAFVLSLQTVPIVKKWWLKKSSHM